MKKEAADPSLKQHLKVLEDDFVRIIRSYCQPLIESGNVTPSVAVKVITDNLFMGDSIIIDVATEQGVPINEIKKCCQRAAIRACNTTNKERKAAGS